MPNIAVFIEQRDGEIKKVAWQMMGKAREIVDAAGGEVWAVLLGEADAGILFRPPDNVIAEFPQYPVATTYDALRAEFTAAAEGMK